MVETESKLQDLKSKLFMLNMKDTWDDSDYRYSNELVREINELKKEMQNG